MRSAKKELLIDGAVVYLALKLFTTSNNLRHQKQENIRSIQERQRRMTEESKEQQELDNKAYTYTFKESALDKIKATLEGLTVELSSHGITADEELISSAHDIIDTIQLLKDANKEELLNGNEA